MKKRGDHRETGSKDAPVVIIDSQDVSPPSPCSSPSLQSDASQSLLSQAWPAAEASGAGETQSVAGQKTSDAVPLDSSLSQGSRQSTDSLQPGEAETSAPAAPSSKKKRRRRKRRNKNQEQEGKEESTQGKKKYRKKTAVTSSPQPGDRVGEGGTVWQQLGACKCDKCGFTTTEESIFQCHICSARRSTPSASPGACASPGRKTPQATPAPVATSSFGPDARATSSPLASVHPAPEAATSTSFQQPQTPAAHQSSLSNTPCSAAATPWKGPSGQPTTVDSAVKASASPSRPVSSQSAASQATPASQRQGTITYDPDTEQYRCCQCGFVIGKYVDFLEHLMFQMLASPYHCQYCPKSFAERASFHRHCASEHPNEKKKCKLRQVSVIKGIMDKAKEEAKVGKPATFNFHSGFRSCVRKLVSQKKIAPASSSSQTRTVVQVTGHSSTAPTSTQVAVSTLSATSATVSSAISETLPSNTEVTHSHQGPSAIASRGLDASALPQASGATTVSAQSQLNSASGNADRPTSAHNTVGESARVQSPVMRASDEAACASKSLVQSTSNRKSLHQQNDTSACATVGPSFVQNSNHEVTDAIEKSATQEADCQMPVIIACQGNYNHHEEATTVGDQSSGISSNNSVPGQLVSVCSGKRLASIVSPGEATNTRTSLVPGPVHASAAVPVSSSPSSHGQGGPLTISVLHSSAPSSARQTVSHAPTLPMSQRVPGITPVRPVGFAQRGQTRVLQFHEQLSSTPSQRYQNIQPKNPSLLNVSLERMVQERAAALHRYFAPGVSRPSVQPQPYSFRGASTLQQPPVQTQNQFVPLVQMIPNSAQSAFTVQQVPQQGPANILVHQRHPLVTTLVQHPVVNQGVRLELPGNVRVVQGTTAQNFVPVQVPGSWQQFRVVSLPSETGSQQPPPPVVTSESTAPTNYSPISPASASPIYTPISPASPARIPYSPVYTPISPASPARIPLSSVYTPISPASTANTGRYSPISPANQSVQGRISLTDSSRSQPLDLSVAASTEQPGASMTSSSLISVRRLHFEGSVSTLTTADEVLTTTTVTTSISSVGVVSSTLTSASVNSVPAPSQVRSVTESSVRVKQEKTVIRPHQSSHSSTPSPPLATSPVTPAPLATPEASQQLVSVEKFFIKYRDSYACLRCVKRFHDSDEFYGHVWSHQHTDGKHCSNCRETESTSPGTSGHNLCTETTRVVERVSGVLMDVGMLSRLNDGCRERLSQRLLHSDAGDATSQVIIASAAEGDATGDVRHNASSLPSCAGDATEQTSRKETSDAHRLPPQVTVTNSAKSGLANDQRGTEDAPSRAANSDLGTPGDGLREDPAQSNTSITQGNVSEALGSDTALPHGSTSNINTNSEQAENDDHISSRPETESASKVTESEHCANPTTGSVNDLEPTEERAARNEEGEDPVQESERPVPETKEGSDVSTEKDQAVTQTETDQRNARGSSESGHAVGTSASVQEEEEAGVDGDAEMTKRSTDSWRAGDKDPSSAVLSQNDDAPLSVDESQEFVLSRDSTPDRTDAPIPPRREPPVFNRSEVFFICALCEFSCCTAVDFTMHLNSEHHEEEAFPCYHCNYQGQYTTDLTNHITAHTSGDSKIYTCPCAAASTLNCPFRTDSLKSLSNHVQCHPGHAFWCNKCDSEFEDDTELLLHLTSNSMTLYSCSKCPSRFLEKAAIQRHWQAQHGGGLAFRVVKMMLCKDRKENSYTLPACPLPLRRLSAEEEASGSRQGSPTQKASAPDQPSDCVDCEASGRRQERIASALDQVSEGVGCDKVLQAPSPCSTAVRDPVCFEKGDGSRQDPVQALSTYLPENEVACSETNLPSHPAFKGSPSPRPSEEDEASNPGTHLHPSSERGTAAPTDEESSSSNVQLSASSSSTTVENSAALVNVAVANSDSPAVCPCSSQTNVSKKTSPLSISKERAGKIPQLVSQIKLPAKSVNSCDREEEQLKVLNLTAFHCKTEHSGDLESIRIQSTVESAEAGRQGTTATNSPAVGTNSSSSLTETVISNEPELMRSLDENSTVLVKAETNGTGLVKTENTGSQGTNQDNGMIVSDGTSPMLPALMKTDGSYAPLKEAADEEIVSAPRDRVSASSDFPGQPEDVMPLKKLLGGDELHDLLLNTLYRERHGEFGQQFVCCICEIGFDKRMLVHKHLFGHFNVPFLMCALCQLGCSSMPEFVSHFGTAHPGEKKTCKNLMVPRSNPLRQLTSDGPLTVEKFGEFCLSFRSEESEGNQDTSSQSLPQGDNDSHNSVRDPPVPPREQQENVHNCPSPAIAQGAESPVADDEKRRGEASDEETKGASLTRQSVSEFETRSLSSSSNAAGKSAATKQPGTCGVKSSHSSMITHRRNSGQGCSRDFNHEESNVPPEQASDEHYRPKLNSKKQNPQGSPARPKPGTYKIVKVGAMSKLKCTACGSMTLSVANMSRHQETCARYNNSQCDSEHTHKAESLAKKMRTGSESNQRNFSESTVSFSSTALERTPFTALDGSAARKSETGVKFAAQWKTSANGPRPGPLSSKLASLKVYKPGAKEKEPAKTRTREKEAKPSASVVREKEAQPSETSAREKEAEPSTSAAREKEADPSESPVQEKEAAPSKPCTREKEAQPSESPAREKEAHPSASPTREKRAQPTEPQAREKKAQPSVPQAREKEADPSESPAREFKEGEPSETPAREKEAAPLELEPLEMLPQLCVTVRKRRMHKESHSGTQGSEAPAKSTQRVDNKSSDEVKFQSGAGVPKDNEQDVECEDSDTPNTQSNTCEPKASANSQSKDEKQKKVKKHKKCARVIYSSSDDDDSDGKESLTEVSVSCQLDPPAAEAVTESKEAEHIFTCKLCDFCAPECQKHDLEAHLQKKHPHLLQLTKCGHCNFLYNSSKPLLKNHTKMSHVGMEESKVKPPLEHFYNSKLKENCSPKSDQEERYTAANKEPAVKRKNTAKRTGPKVGTAEAALGTTEPFLKESTEALQTRLEAGTPESDSTDLRSVNTAMSGVQERETVKPTPAASAPATQNSLLRTQNTERSVWTALAAPESGLAASELENKTPRSDEDTSQKAVLTNSSAGRKIFMQPLNAGHSTGSGAKTQTGSTCESSDVRPTEATLSEPIKGQSVAEPQRTKEPEEKGTVKPCSSAESVSKTSALKPQKLNRPTGTKAGAAETASSLSEPGSKKSVLKPQNTARTEGATSEAGSVASKSGSKESLLKPQSTHNPTGPKSGTNKANVHKHSTTKHKSSTKQKEPSRGTEESISEPVSKKSKVSGTITEVETESAFQSKDSATHKRKRERPEDSVKRSAAKTARLTLRTQLEEGGSDLSDSNDEDFSLEKHSQQSRPNKVKRFAFLETDDFKSNKKPSKKPQTSRPSGSLARKTTETRPGSASSAVDRAGAGSRVTADTAVSQTGASTNTAAENPSANSSISTHSVPKASVVSTGGHQTGQRQATGTAKNQGGGGANAKKCRYVCVMENCNQRHMEQKKMKAHLIRHIDYRTIPCCCCCMEFMDVSEAKNHHTNKHPDSAYNMTVSRDPQMELKLTKLLGECLQKAQSEAAAVSSTEEAPADTCETTQTVVWKQSIQCRQCQALHDSISELKKHCEEKHEGKRERMEWVDVKTQGVYDLKGTLHRKGPGSLSLVYKHLCAFCSFRAVQKELVTEHKQEAHPDMTWQWTLTLQVALPISLSHSHTNAVKPVSTPSSSSSLPSPSMSPAHNPAVVPQQRSKESEASATTADSSTAEKNLAKDLGPVSQGAEGSQSGGSKSGLKVKRLKKRDPKLRKACVVMKDLLNAHNKEELSLVCRSAGVTSIQFDRRDRGSKHKKLLEPENN